MRPLARGLYRAVTGSPAIAVALANPMTLTIVTIGGGRPIRVVGLAGGVGPRRRHARDASTKQTRGSPWSWRPARSNALRERREHGPTRRSARAQERHHVANSAVVHVRGEIERIRGDVDRLTLEATPKHRRRASRSLANEAGVLLLGARPICSKNSGSLRDALPGLEATVPETSAQRAAQLASATSELRREAEPRSMSASSALSEE